MSPQSVYMETLSVCTKLSLQVSGHLLCGSSDTKQVESIPVKLPFTTTLPEMNTCPLRQRRSKESWAFGRPDFYEGSFVSIPFFTLVPIITLLY